MMYLGIEIGGTKVQLGVGPGDGTLLDFQRLPVDVAQGAEGIRRQILEAAPRLIEAARARGQAIRGVGYGFGGPVDDATRRVLKSHQVEGWADFPLAEWTEEHLKLPTVLGNDCDVAGLAEALFGAGKGLSPIFYITIGSGIGGGLIIDGEIYRGCGKGAAEIGHLWASYDLSRTDESDLARWRVLEKCSSGWAIEEKAQREGKALLNLMKARKGPTGAAGVAACASRGQRWALDVLRNARLPLALALAQVVALLCPRRIVIGGGVSLMGEELFFQPVREEVARFVFKPFADCYDIVPAALGEEVVVHGALALARKRLGS